jgi:hypothetical protein
MARSLKNKLSEIAKTRQKAQELTRRALEQEEKIIAPTRNKISGLFSDRISAFLQGNIERIPAMKVHPASLATAIDEFLGQHLFAVNGSELIEDEDDSEETLPEPESVETTMPNKSETILPNKPVGKAPSEA